jgi:CubicO group peptidase (beta-lactamase class C family)
LQESSVPGAALAIVQQGELIWSKGYGVADRRTGRPVTSHTRFQWGSIGKSLTAWAVMSLAEKGSIELGTPIERYVRRWKLPESGYDPGGVTIRRVLSHTAGLSVRGYHGVDVLGDPLPRLEESLAGYAGSDGGLRVVQQPGDAFTYSSGGYTLLQLMIEERTQETFPSYMERLLF